VTASRRPTRATVEGRAYLDLQNLARSQQRPTDDLHVVGGDVADSGMQPDPDPHHLSVLARPGVRSGARAAPR
jgi:hypothetical protein